MIFLQGANLVLAAIYRPPRCPEDSFSRCLGELSKFIMKFDAPEVLVTGDFNLPFVNWNTGSINKVQRLTSEVKSAENLLHFSNDHFLVQSVEETTRDEKNILDLIFTNNHEAIHRITVEKTKASDHDLVCASLNYTKLQQKDLNQKPNASSDSPFDDLKFAKADWDAIRKELNNTDWEPYFQSKDPTELSEMLDSKVSEACAKHTPCHSASKGSTPRIPPKRRALLRKKKRLNSRINCLKYLATEPQPEKIKALEQEKIEIEIGIRDSIKEEKSSEEAEAIERIKTNSKAFYSYAKRFCKTKDPIGPLKDTKGKLQNDASNMANLLQDQYSQVFSDPSEITVEPAEPDQDNLCPTIEDIEFNEEDIVKAIDDISRHSATGPDKFPAEVLKECKHQLCLPIKHLWRTSLDCSEIPSVYLQQTIVPIFKKGDRSQPENYRPVSLTSHIIKIFERVMRKRLVDHIENNNLLSNQQHGFRQKRNCLTQLIHHIEDILHTLENDANADVIYLDFSKAFDKVDHRLLLQKLSRMGIHGKLLSWITAFLSNRKQCVLVKGTKSRPILVISGVPQGTVLGPLLFIVFINDITEVVKHSHIKIFADDSKLQGNIKSLEDKANLQEDLNAVVKWAKDNNMELNEKKFELLHHGYNEPLKEDYTLPSGKTITSSYTVKDLGIYINDKLSWSDHYYNMIKEAKKYAGWILRTFTSRSKKVILLLYGSFVRSRLEYSCPLWVPYTKKDIMNIEAVQRSITAKIFEVSHLNYWDRLKALKLYSLQRRRERYCIIHVWKMLNDLTPNDINLSFRTNPRLGPVAELPKLISKRQHINTLRDQSFSCLGPRLFNLLPRDLKNMSSLPHFKSNLDQFLKLFPDTPPTPGYIAANGNSLVDWVACGTPYDYKCGDAKTTGGATLLDMA